VKHVEEAAQKSPSKSISIATTKLKLFCVTSLHLHDTLALKKKHNDDRLYYSAGHHLRN
jgi:hypothetical protein